MLGVIQVSTPEPALDVMVDGWLVYQAVANCTAPRMGEGLGERAAPSSDQLLDALAALHTHPQLLRGQLLRFGAGDADDCIWLPYATARYVAATGDDEVLAEYDSKAAATLYLRCVRAVRQLLDSDRAARGDNACPPWFVAHVLELFADLAGREGDQGLADNCRDHAGQLAAQATSEDGAGERDVRSQFWIALARGRAGDSERAWELLRRLNPVNMGAMPGSAGPGGAAPYALAPGTAGLMHLLAVETLLGLRLQEGSLVLAPVVPGHWPGFTMRYRHGTARYLIDVRRAGQASLKLDGRPVEGSTIPLMDDGAEHRIEMWLAPGLPTVS
jgi:cellobiose phosphorylase